jgi:hypothetical protein
MFQIKCQAENTVTLAQLRQFQGDLKKRNPSDIDDLISSIKEDGLLMPLAIWENGEICSILDGHARYEAFVKMAVEDPTILTTQLPVIIIKAADEAEAQKALLQITSSYGKVTKKGLAAFVAKIPNYTSVAPIVVKTMKPVKAQSTGAKAVDVDAVTLKLKVNKNMVIKLTELLAGVEGVTIL